MKHLFLITILFTFILHPSSFTWSQTIVDPENFAEQSSLDGDDLWLFSKRGGTGTWRKVSEATLRDYIASEVNPTSVGYVPSATGNTANLNEYVTASNGHIYFIDSSGRSVLVRKVLLQGYDLAQMGASPGQALLWDDIEDEWTPGSISGGIADGDKEDITVSNNGTIWTIDDGTVTLSKLANGTADRLMGYDASGNPSEVAVSGNVTLSSGLLTVTGDADADPDNEKNLTVNGSFSFTPTPAILSRLWGDTGDGVGKYQTLSGGIIDGTGSANRIPYFSDANTLTTSANFTSDGSRFVLSGTLTPPLRVGYSPTVYTDFSTTSFGTGIIAPTGANLSIDGKLSVGTVGSETDLHCGQLWGMSKETNNHRFKAEPTSPQFQPEQIGVEAGIIRDVVMAQAGPAKGHGFSIDEQFIADLVAFDSKHFSKTGIKARFGHPALSDTTMGKQMGTFQNFRIRGDQAIADLHLLESANLSPTTPNMREWMLKMAQEQPDFVMSSIVFKVGEFFQFNDEGKKVVLEKFSPGWDKPEFDDREVYASLGEHFYTDLVEQGAVTDHLFSQQFNQDKFAIQVVEFVQGHPKLLAFLKENPGKLIEFSEKLGIELPQPSFTQKLAGLKELLFGAKSLSKQEVATALDEEALRTEIGASIRTELEGECQEKMDALNAEIADLTQANESITEEIAELKEQVPNELTDPELSGPNPTPKRKKLDPVTEKAVKLYEKHNPKN